MGQGPKGLAGYLIRMSFNKMKPLPDALHRRALSLMREYMLVGGMPEPVSIYVEQRAFAPVDASKRRIVQLYRNDISRFATGYEFKVVSVLDGIPVSSLGTKNDSSFPHLRKTRACAPTRRSLLLAGRRANCQYLLCRKRTERGPFTQHGANGPQVLHGGGPGLLVTLAFSDNNDTDEDVYRAVLRGDIGLNEGMLTENYVAQSLKANGHRLFFYSQSGKKEGEERMEIDFLVTRPYVNAAGKPRISPIEVKSPRKYGTISLDRFRARF